MSTNVSKLLRLIQFCDSALPVGGFSFSSTIESAAAYGVVHDVESLKGYARAVLNQTLRSDCVAAIHTLRECSLQESMRADRELTACKLSEEQRLMSVRMGRRLAELGAVLIPENDLLSEWAGCIKRSETAGNYAISQALLFSANKLSTKELFAAQCYGVLSVVLNSTLRCIRLSHLTTQKIMYELTTSADEIYPSIAQLTLEQMHSFSPQIDILSSLHAKGISRMFMS